MQDNLDTRKEKVTRQSDGTELGKFEMKTWLATKEMTNKKRECSSTSEFKNIKSIKNCCTDFTSFLWHIKWQEQAQKKITEIWMNN